MFKTNGIFISLLVLLLFAEFGCKKDLLSTNQKDKLLFRNDTVFFDTVFTKNNQGQPRSVNKQVVVVNPNSNDIETDIRLNNPNGYFKLNADGVPGREFNNVRIRAGDSIFLFIELYIDQNNDPSARPLIVRDSISFFTNTNEQNIQLVAWGQDANYFRNDTLACNTVWDNIDKPYVVYGYAYVPKGCNLTIKKGVKVNFAPYSWLYVEGTLKIEGTKDEKVKMEGDRLQPAFEETPGQWGGIWLAWPSVNNTITHAEIKNATVGIYCDTVSANTSPNVIVKYTTVRNMLYDGLAGRMSTIRAENCVFENCGRYSFIGQWGGNYQLTHCTFATYNLNFSRRDPTFVFSNRQRDELGRILKTFDFAGSITNSIIYGSQLSELGFDLDQSRVSNLYIGGNLIRTEDKSLGAAPFTNVINKDPKFVDYTKHDFNLDTLSGAKDIGEVLLPPVTKDFLEKLRDAKPDAGAYERFD